MFVIIRRACALVRIPMSRFVNLTLTRQIPLQGQTRGVLGLVGSHASRLCLQTDRFFFPAWPTVYTKSKNTLLSNVELLKTLAYRFRADGRVKTEVMSLL